MFTRNEITSEAHPTRIYHPYTALEEFHPHGGMWAIPKAGERGGFIEASAAIMADPAAFKAAMMVALDEWPHSVACALTTPGLNRRAWMGHAGCYLATGSPEETTRLGWHELDEHEQRIANEGADDVIEEWTRRNHDDDGQGGLWDA